MLWMKECKKTVCSIIFVLYAAAVAAMYITQFVPELKDAPAKPNKGALQPGEGYGSTIKEDPAILMPAAVESLICEYLEGSYRAYPLLFYKDVRLKEEDSAGIAAVIEELTGLTKTELDRFDAYEPERYEAALHEDGEQSIVYKEAQLPAYSLRADISYERFRELMTIADEIIGGASKYSEQFLLYNFARVSMTYEEALAEYEEITDEENIAGSYSRLYCDYMGIILSIMPVFVCAGLWQMDKRSRMEELIYSRKISSLKLIITRYLSMLLCMSIPVILTFLHAMICIGKLYPEKNIHFGNAIALTMVWLIPAIMAVTGTGALISELFSPLFAIFVQGAWWYIAVQSNQNAGSITKYSLIVRHNTLGSMKLFQIQYGNFMQNRMGYLILSMIVLLCTVIIYHWHRKGAGHAKKILWKNTVRKSKA